MKKICITENEKKKMLELYNKGLTDREVANALNRSIYAVHKWRNANGLLSNYEKSKGKRKKISKIPCVGCVHYERFDGSKMMCGYILNTGEARGCDAKNCQKRSEDKSLRRKDKMHISSVEIAWWYGYACKAANMRSNNM